MSGLKPGLGLLVVGFFAFVGATTIAGAARPTSYDPLGSGALHCSEFYSLLESYGAKMLTTSYSYLRDTGPGSALVIMGPTEPFTFEEYRELDRFIREGGTLILIADNDGTGHTLQFGGEPWEKFWRKPPPGIGVYNSPVRDFDRYDRCPDFVLLTGFSPHPIFQGVSAILTNYPATLGSKTGFPAEETYGRVGVSAVAYTSDRSFLDRNKSGQPDPDEPTGPLPLIAVLDVEEGQFVAIADPGIFVNDTMGRANNRQFATSLFDWATEGGTKPLAFDLTHNGYAHETWLEIVELGKRNNFLIGLLAFTGALCAFAALQAKWAPPAPEKPKGRFTRLLRRYRETLGTRIKTDLNEPLLLYYEHFLARCSKAFGLKEAGAGSIMKRVRREYPELYPQLERVMNLCEQVRLGLRDVNSAKAFRNAIDLMRRFEEEVS